MPVPMTSGYSAVIRRAFRYVSLTLSPTVLGTCSPFKQFWMNYVVGFDSRVACVVLCRSDARAEVCVDARAEGDGSQSTFVSRVRDHHPPVLPLPGAHPFVVEDLVETVQELIQEQN